MDTTEYVPLSVPGLIQLCQAVIQICWSESEVEILFLHVTIGKLSHAP